MIWTNIEKQISAGTFLGTFNYNGNEIIETDSSGKIRTHSDIIFVEYIESTGTQYIDTGIVANQDTKLEILAATTDDVSDASSGMGFIPYGAGIAYNSSAFECYSQSNQFEFNYGTQNAFIGTAKIGEKISILQDKNILNIMIGSVQHSYSFNYTSFETPRTITLFAINRNPVMPGKARIYSCKLYDNGVLVRDFKPALDDNNIPCLYDKVTQQYFYNAGTGTFNYQ